MLKREKDIIEVESKILTPRELDKLRAEALHQYPLLEKSIIYYMNGNCKIKGSKLACGAVLFTVKKG